MDKKNPGLLAGDEDGCDEVDGDGRDDGCGDGLSGLKLLQRQWHSQQQLDANLSLLDDADETLRS